MAARLQPGDLLFFWGRGWVSRLIELATRGPSHVGIACPHNERLLVFESTTLCPLPCALTGRPSRGVQAHGVELRVAACEGRVARLPLAPFWRLNRAEEELLHRLLVRHLLGRAYDLEGALLAGSRWFKWSHWMPYPDLATLFCSEMVAALLMRLARLPLGNPAAYHPAGLLRALRRCGTYAPPEMLK